MRNVIIKTIRYLLAIALGVFFSQMISLGISFWYVLLALVSGIFLSNHCLKNNFSAKRIILIHVLAIVGLEVIFFGFNQAVSIFSTSGSLDLYPGTLHAQTAMFVCIYLLSFTENYLFWTRANFLIIELLVSGSILTLLLSGHRNYNIDMPNALSSLTWKHPLLQKFNIEPQQLLIITAFFFAALSLVYAALAAQRTIISKSRVIIQRSKSAPLVATLLTFFILVLIGYSASIVLSRYNAELSQVMNGVGPSSDIKDGESNLGFNEASQPSNQPAALLRLLNSYESNPWEGMLYLREGALSAYAGREMVKGPADADTDAPHINPAERTSIQPLGEAALRIPVKQAVYMLSDKISPFAIDTPVQFIPIKNPNPRRFRYAYTVQSLALAESIDSLKWLETGDPSWPDHIWEYYLRAPGSRDILEFETKDPAELSMEDEILSDNNEDLRYLALARELTGSLHSPMEKVFSVIDYLSKESIYVLKPGHQLGPRGDPVAPYLFAEKKRGYCVHYAHAAVYLLRLAGIPSRIGTGFLVDLQYAKGGDILVQMGDRHAWPEVFIRDRGWIAIDVNPAEAENDQVAIPDESLLEQLMSEIDPIEELLGAEPKLETLKDKKSPIEEFLDSGIFSTYPLYALAAVLIFMLLGKIFIRHAWMFCSNPRKKLRYLYLSTISTLEDLGNPRYFGETRMEYAERIEGMGRYNARYVTAACVKHTKKDSHITSSDIPTDIRLLRTSGSAAASFLKRLWYLLSYLNPASLKNLKYFFRSGSLHSVLIATAILSPSVSYAIPGIEHDDSNYLHSSETLTDSDKGKSPEVLLNEGILLYQTGRGIDARAKFEEVLALTPNDYQPYYHLGQYYLIDVGHFKLAYRYLKKARELFEDRYTIMGSEFLSDLQVQNEYSMLLYLVAESALNLDFYEESLEVLDEYAQLYQSAWYPGQKAWVLMKLKRVEEAIDVAKTGLLQGADPKRTWNILGILLSISGQRELSLEAFARAVDYEFTTRGNTQAATPLNNAGEVYRELFKDDLAESAWKTALKLPDGCEHILPSINLSILYTDQLRIFQAMQALADFEGCYAKRPERKDTEHRTILALARGKLQIFLNRPEEAIRLLTRAASDQQWFGKIGTNENDVKFAAWAALAQAHRLESERLLDTATDSFAASLKNRLAAYQHRASSWWLNRTAKLFSTTELDDFEDLTIRNTDTMITYPMLGSLLAYFDTTSLERRISRLLEKDTRENAKPYYSHYLARNYYHKGNTRKALSLAKEIHELFPEHERLIQAENLALKILAQTRTMLWWRKKNLFLAQGGLIEPLYRISPVHLRLYNIPLPVQLEIEENINKSSRKDITSYLLRRRFVLSDSADTTFRIQISKSSGDTIHIQLYDLLKNRKVTSIEADKDIPEAVNSFIQEVFSHREDPVSRIPPPVPFMKKYGNF
jgi:transglutaminase-like putative cysteine protease/tetratricopeptide (TPR) repeat protein